MSHFPPFLYSMVYPCGKEGFRMKKGRCADICARFTRCRGMHAVTFGLGMAVACFCPLQLVLFFSAVIMVALGISLLRRA